MSTYDLIVLVSAGDVFAVQTRSDGRVFASGPLHHDEQDADFASYDYDEEWHTEAYALGIASQDTESAEPMGDRFRVIRSA